MCVFVGGGGGPREEEVPDVSGMDVLLKIQQQLDQIDFGCGGRESVKM